MFSLAKKVMNSPLLIHDRDFSSQEGDRSTFGVVTIEVECFPTRIIKAMRNV